MSPAGWDESLRRSLQDAVGSQFTIGRLLGRGGMGSVYLARDTLLPRFVAIKVVSEASFAEPAARTRFREEMRIIARFTHPHIIAILTCGEYRKLDYFVMRYVSGDTIASRLQDEGPLPPDDVRRILTELADALQYAHARNVIHRDIKPANVLIDDESKCAFLTDFGVARILESTATSSGKVAGTLGYIAPEAFNGPVDSRADVFALGVLGYEMLTGRRPFTGDTAVQLINSTLNSCPPQISAVVPNVPPDLADAVMSCLAKDPALRPSAREARLRFGMRETDESSMPQDLRDMAGFGSWALLWISVWAALGVLSHERPAVTMTFLFLALIVPTGFVLQVVSMRPANLPLGQIVRVAFWPPKWWGMWWPPPLRRPVDLWPGLPGRAKAVRVGLSALLVAAPLLLLIAMSARVLRMVPSAVEIAGGAIAVMALIVGGILIEAWRWARGNNLGPRQAVRFMIGPTIESELWRSAAVARLLLQREHSRPPDNDEAPTNAHQCYERVRKAADAVSQRDGMGDAGVRATEAALHLRMAIDDLDREIHEHWRDRDPDMIVQIEARLADYDETRPVERDAAREGVLAELHRLRGIESALELAMAQRTRMFDLQCTIWHQLSTLRRGDSEAHRQALLQSCRDAMSLTANPAPRPRRLRGERATPSYERRDSRAT